MEDSDRSYSPPEIVVVGSVSEVTQGFHHPMRELDGTYPARTPVSSPIWS
jgi:hypothetical protein